MSSLCGRSVCPRLCERACHCQAGLVRRRELLRQQALRRKLRRQERGEPCLRQETGIRSRSAELSGQPVDARRFAAARVAASAQTTRDQELCLMWQS